MDYNTIVDSNGNAIHMVRHPIFDRPDIRVLPPFQTIRGIEPVSITVTEDFFYEIFGNLDKELTNIDGSFEVLDYSEEEDFFENVYTILIRGKIRHQFPITIMDLRLSSTGYWASMMSAGMVILDPKL